MNCFTKNQLGAKTAVVCQQIVNCKNDFADSVLEWPNQINKKLFEKNEQTLFDIATNGVIIFGVE